MVAKRRAAPTMASRILGDSACTASSVPSSPRSVTCSSSEGKTTVATAPTSISSEKGRCLVASPVTRPTSAWMPPIRRALMPSRLMESSQYKSPPRVHWSASQTTMNSATPRRTASATWMVVCSLACTAYLVVATSVREKRGGPLCSPPALLAVGIGVYSSWSRKPTSSSDGMYDEKHSAVDASFPPCTCTRSLCTAAPLTALLVGSTRRQVTSNASTLVEQHVHRAACGVQL
mmetsp:Transcript_15259/g.35103  ORF Transcript_15259/g.35103 Transcript_15259/m.35103 type:complete len:233 (-) Transcript_15259:251-949(-)